MESHQASSSASSEEPVSSKLEDNKRPDGIAIPPRDRDKPLAWDVAVPDTYAESHWSDAVATLGAAAHQAAQHTMGKYSNLSSTHVFIETTCTWNVCTLSSTRLADRRITEDAWETHVFVPTSVDERPAYDHNRLSSESLLQSFAVCSVYILIPTGLVLVGKKITLPTFKVNVTLKVIWIAGTRRCAAGVHLTKWAF